MGRPTKLTKALRERIRAACLLGATNQEIALSAGVSEKTLYNYLNNDSDFLQDFESWKNSPILKARKTIIDNLDQPRVAMWFIERKSRELPTQLQVETKVIKTEQLVDVSDDVLKRIIKSGYEFVGSY